jgi:DNA-binding CsgD family transcriptional regulator
MRSIEETPVPETPGRRRRPSAGRLESALAASAEWHTASSVDALAARVCSSLRQLVPCTAAGWNEIDLDGRVVRVHSEPELEFRHASLNRLIRTHPLVRHALETGDLGATTISELLDVDAFHRTRLYREVYRGLNVEDQLGAAVEVGGSHVVGIALNRSERSFTDEDRSLLDLVRPHIVAAYAQIVGRREAEERTAALAAGLEQSGHTVVFLDESGAVADAPPAARILLERWFGGRPARIAPGTYEGADARLTVRAVDAGRTRLLLLDEERLLADPERARRFGLTERETQVLSLVARGLTNRAIGEQLEISARTVHKHLENVYAKLGVGTRADALALFSDDAS